MTSIYGRGLVDKKSSEVADASASVASWAYHTTTTQACKVLFEIRAGTQQRIQEVTDFPLVRQKLVAASIRGCIPARPNRNFNHDFIP
jgi:hypothetical protein